MNLHQYKVWQCIAYTNGDTGIPNGADFPPRRAAIEALEGMGIEVSSCASGWGGSIFAYDLKRTQAELLFDKIKHGDLEHQLWLKDTIDAFFGLKGK